MKPYPQYQPGTVVEVVRGAESGKVGKVAGYYSGTAKYLVKLPRENAEVPVRWVRVRGVDIRVAKAPSSSPSPVKGEGNSREGEQG